LGIAFQLQDDLLDAFGNPEEFGKKIGGDIVNNKKTFLMLKAFELADLSQRKKLNKLLSEKNEDTKVQSVLEIYRELKVDQLTQNEISNYHNAAVELINSLNVSNSSVQALIHLADKLAVRIS
jgi:geranylgeranyl diphosphate synthase type II